MIFANPTYLYLLLLLIPLVARKEKDKKEYNTSEAIPVEQVFLCTLPKQCPVELFFVVRHSRLVLLRHIVLCLYPVLFLHSCSNYSVRYTLIHPQRYNKILTCANFSRQVLANSPRAATNGGWHHASQGGISA